MGVNITTIAYIRVLIIEIGEKTIILMVVEAQGNGWSSLGNLRWTVEHGTGQFHGFFDGFDIYDIWLVPSFTYICWIWYEIIYHLFTRISHRFFAVWFVIP